MSAGRFRWPERVGPYRVVRLLGQGGMGAVVEARDERVGGRRVAIKLLLKGREADSAARKRFLREGALLAKVRHRSVVAVHDAGESEGLPYLVLDLVEGESLQDKMARHGPFGSEDVIRIGAQVAAALQAAHEKGVLHRDLKPDNVLLEPSGRALLTDFGLAKDLDSLGQTQRLTQSAVYLGTPGYWSPEQASAKPGRITRSSDVFGLGATLHGLLTGGPPFEGETFMALVVRTLEEPPGPLPPGVPAGLRAVIERCLMKDPLARYPSAAALAEDLGLLAQGKPLVHAQVPPPRAPRRIIAALTLAIAVVLAIPLFRAVEGESHRGSPTPSVSESRGPDAEALWKRHREALDAGDLELAAGALESAREAGSPDAEALLEARWPEIRLAAPRGPQLRLHFIEHDPPLLALLSLDFAVFWELRATKAEPRRVLIPAPALASLARQAPRLVSLRGAEVLVREVAGPGETRTLWKRPLILQDYDTLTISPRGTRIAYTTSARLYVEDALRKWSPVSLPLGSAPQVQFLDEDTLCLAAGNMDPTLPGWIARVDLRQKPSVIDPLPFLDPGPQGTPSWPLGNSRGWALFLSRDADSFLVGPPEGAPFGFSFEVGEAEREAPPFTLGAGVEGRPPLFLALKTPGREGTPLEVHALEGDRLRLLLSRRVQSGSDALAISADQRMIATGDQAEGVVYVYLTGGRRALEAR